LNQLLRLDPTFTNLVPGEYVIVVSTPNNCDFDCPSYVEVVPGNCLEEICDNDIDDDGDGLTDCEDPDCNDAPTSITGCLTFNNDHVTTTSTLMDPIVESQDFTIEPVV